MLTPKIGTGERLICGLSLVINSIRQEKSHQRIRQGRLRSAIRLRSARGLFALIFRGMRDDMARNRRKGRMGGWTFATGALI
jgi:hypothetical protein